MSKQKFDNWTNPPRKINSCPDIMRTYSACADPIVDDSPIRRTPITYETEYTIPTLSMPSVRVRQEGIHTIFSEKWKEIPDAEIRITASIFINDRKFLAEVIIDNKVVAYSGDCASVYEARAKAYHDWYSKFVYPDKLNECFNHYFPQIKMEGQSNPSGETINWIDRFEYVADTKENTDEPPVVTAIFNCEAGVVPRWTEQWKDFPVSVRVAHMKGVDNYHLFELYIVNDSDSPVISDTEIVGARIKFRKAYYAYLNKQKMKDDLLGEKETKYPYTAMPPEAHNFNGVHPTTETFKEAHNAFVNSFRGVFLEYEKRKNDSYDLEEARKHAEACEEKAILDGTTPDSTSTYYSEKDKKVFSTQYIQEAHDNFAAEQEERKKVFDKRMDECIEKIQKLEKEFASLKWWQHNKKNKINLEIASISLIINNIIKTIKKEYPI